MFIIKDVSVYPVFIKWIFKHGISIKNAQEEYEIKFNSLTVYRDGTVPSIEGIDYRVDICPLPIYCSEMQSTVEFNTISRSGVSKMSGDINSVIVDTQGIIGTHLCIPIMNGVWFSPQDVMLRSIISEKIMVPHYMYINENAPMIYEYATYLANKKFIEKKMKGTGLKFMKTWNNGLDGVEGRDAYVAKFGNVIKKCFNCDTMISYYLNECPEGIACYLCTSHELVKLGKYYEVPESICNRVHTEYRKRVPYKVDISWNSNITSNSYKTKWYIDDIPVISRYSPGTRLGEKIYIGSVIF